MSSYAFESTSATTGLGVRVSGLPQQYFGDLDPGPQRRTKREGVRAYLPSGVGKSSSISRRKELLNGGVLVYSANRVQFGTALARFVQREPVKASATVRSLAARALAARALRKEMPSEEWAERFTQNTHDE